VCNVISSQTGICIVVCNVAADVRRNPHLHVSRVLADDIADEGSLRALLT
jgi:hypothetical protein